MPPPLRAVWFRLPDQSDRPSWFALEVEAQESWLLFLNINAERRRLSPVPQGWQQLEPADLAALLARATPVPPVPLGLPTRAHPPAPSVEPAAPIDDELALERERRIGAEAMLQEALTALRDMERDLLSANAELQSLNEEVEEMARMLAAQA